MSRRKKAKKIVKSSQEPKAMTRLNLVCLEDVMEELIKWLWQPYIPLGKITILEGDPDSGKSYLSLALAAYVTAGRLIPFDKDTASKLPRNVLMLVGEDGAADTIKPRFRKVLGNMARLTLLEGIVTSKEGEDDMYSSITLDNIPVLEEALVTLRPALVIIDPFQCFLGQKVDMYRANETRPILSALSKLAERYECALLLIRHLKKMDSKTIYRGIGAIDILAAARSVLLAGRNPQPTAALTDLLRTDASGAVLEPKDRFAIVQTKCNLGKKGPSLEYSIDDTGLTIDGISEITDDELLNSTMKTVNQDIDEWLEDLLSSGPMEANAVKGAAATKGYGRTKLVGAVKRLGIWRKPMGFGGSWTWELPKQQDAKAEEQGEQDASEPEGETAPIPACAESLDGVCP